ncbi:pleckstrin homology domain-containing family O member 2 [Phyllopteryx taeniolatus]|uniref:pleckstrin homology domain-containing family O member 2 n=1 Tax=Phyllopteryx taeniolatus TaxID=161469 RepID=UPI002AD2B316|nr:pleckstrin homology domain-containing family O member 2 [Phyllopteryx taeniolatus]
MENATREEQPPHVRNKPKSLGKAGWVKKASCRLLASYKDCYIHVDDTAILLYENEEAKNCIERLDLQNYDRCHGLKSIFMRKHRLILIGLPKSGSKIHNMKFQVQTAEEKEAWIQALSDGIDRAKNKVLDEVKMDESSNLLHLTRTRPKGNRNRRPPTRIHLKEGAELSAEALLRLDLDLLDAAVANGTYGANVDDTDMPRETNKSSELQCDSTEKSHAKTQTESKVLKLPMQRQEKAAWQNTSSPNPTDSSSSELAGNSQLKGHIRPPTPPTKDKKPSYGPSQPNREAECTPDSREDKRQVHTNENARGPRKKYETLPCVGDDATTVSEDEDTKRASSKLSIQPVKGDTTGEDHNSCLQRSLPSTSLCSDVLRNNPATDSQMFFPTPQEKTIDADEGCQHLNAKSEVSARENTFAMSTSASGGNDMRTDAPNTRSRGNLMPMPPIVTATTDVGSNVSMCRRSEATPLSTKIRTVSFGDLLSDSSIIIWSRCRSEAIMRNRVCCSNTGRDEECAPGDLLTKAAEKFKEADYVLKEVKKLKHTKSLRKTNSW